MNSKEIRDESYRKLVQSKRLNTQQEAVLKFFLIHGARTDQEMARRTGISLNMMNARRNELVEQGLVKEFGSEIGNSNRSRTVWALVEPGEVLEVKHFQLTNSEMTKLENLVRKANNFQKEKIKEMLE